MKLKKLRSKMLLVIIPMVAISVFAMGFVAYRVAQETLMARGVERLEALAAVHVNWIANFLKGQVDTAVFYAADGIIEETMGKVAAGEKFDEEKFVKYLKEQKDLDKDILELLVLDPQGIIRFDTSGRQTGHNLAARDYFKNAKEKPYLMPPYLSQALKIPSYTASAPIKTKAGKFVGVLVVRFDLQEFFQVTKNHTGLGQTGEVLFGKKEGDEVLYLNPLRFDADAAFKKKASIHSQTGSPVIKAASGQNSTGTSRDYRGKEVEAVCHYLPEFGVGMVVKMDVDELNAPAVVLRNWIAGIGLGVMVIFCLVAFFFSGYISRPLAALSRQAKLLAEGDLRQDISLARNDEIGELSQSLGTVIKSWQSMVQKILDGAVKLSTAAAEIAATSEEMSRGADSQMTQILKTSSGMEEMSGSIQEVSRNAQNTSEAAVAASSLASEGSVKVKDTVARIAAVNESIKKLNQRSQEIGKVVQLIGEIAAQTNILSLNAAIEAARAGEHGRGFEVVAEEIRKLAQRTTESTAEIAALIEEIKNENQEAARMMEAGTVMATEAGQTLENIVGGIVSTTDMVQVISSAAAQQARAAEEIAEALQSISGVSKQTVTASRETVKSTQDLSALADQLKEVTGQFRI